MRRWLWIVAVLIVVGGALVHTSRGQLPTGKPPVEGPGDGGATLKLPGVDPVRSPGAGGAAPLPYYLQNLPTSPYPGSKSPNGKVAEPPKNANDMNRDIEITPEAGPWAIFVMSYSGDEAPMMARKFVAVLRGQYKLNAYVYNYGTKEKKDEYDRVQKIRQEQIDALKEAKLPTNVPIRVAAVRVEEQTGVLIGGYRSFEEASSALKNTIRKLDAEGLLGKVDLDGWALSVPNDPNMKKATKVNLEGMGFVNPFKRAFPARNPALPKEGAPVGDDEMKLFRHVNEGEEFSLLKCKKPYTLAIKQFNMQGKTLGSKKEMTGFLAYFNSGALFKSNPWEDAAAHNAHRLAEAFRKAGYPETYVLHCKHCSFVTIGNYDSEKDAQLIAMQNYLETLFKADGYQRLEVFPRPVVMRVPGVQAAPGHAMK